MFSKFVIRYSKNVNRKKQKAGNKKHETIGVLKTGENLDAVDLMFTSSIYTSNISFNDRLWSIRCNLPPIFWQPQHARNIKEMLIYFI